MRIVAARYTVPALGMLLAACAAEDAAGRAAVPTSVATPSAAGSPAVPGASAGESAARHDAITPTPTLAGPAGASAAPQPRPSDPGPSKPVTPDLSVDGSAATPPAADGGKAALGGAGAASHNASVMAGAAAPRADDTFTFPSVEDFERDGPFTSMSEAGGLTCTIFRPKTLGEQGRRHPVLVWGNGTFNTPSSYTSFLLHLASHGFIVTAANTSDSGSGREMIDCLDYIIDRSQAEGPYRGVVDLDRVLATGYSQGGAGSMMAARDPRFVATGLISPFIVLPLGGFSIAAIADQIYPMFMISGTADSVAVPDANQRPIFMQANVPIVWGTLTGATHLEVLGTGGRYRGVLTAWYRARLMNDPKAADLFSKSKCGLCNKLGWSVEWNDLWKD